MNLSRSTARILQRLDYTGSGRNGGLNQPGRCLTKWAMYAVSASDDGMSGPRWQRTHMLVASGDWWYLMLLRYLPFQVYNTS